MKDLIETHLIKFALCFASICVAAYLSFNWVIHSLKKKKQEAQ